MDQEACPKCVGFQSRKKIGGASKKLRERIGESGSKLTSLRSFSWGMDSRVEDEGQEVALIAADPLNPREILTICANAKSIRPTALLPLNSRKSP